MKALKIWMFVIFTCRLFAATPVEVTVNFTGTPQIGHQVLNTALGANWVWDYQSPQVSFSYSSINEKPSQDLVFFVSNMECDSLLGCILDSDPNDTFRFSLSSSSGTLDIGSWLADLRTRNRITNDKIYALGVMIVDGEGTIPVANSRVNAVLNQEQIGISTYASSNYRMNLQFIFRESPSYFQASNISKVTPEPGVFPEGYEQWGTIPPEELSPIGSVDDKYVVPNGIVGSMPVTFQATTSTDVYYREWELVLKYEPTVPPYDVVTVSPPEAMRTQTASLGPVANQFTFQMPEYDPNRTLVEPNREWFSLRCRDYDGYGYPSSDWSAPFEFHVGPSHLHEVRNNGGEIDAEQACLLVSLNPWNTGAPTCSDNVYDPSYQSYYIYLMVKQFTTAVFGSTTPGQFLEGDLPSPKTDIEIEVTDSSGSSQRLLHDDENFDHRYVPNSPSHTFHSYLPLHTTFSNWQDAASFPLQMRFRRYHPWWGWSVWSDTQVVTNDELPSSTGFSSSVRWNPPPTPPFSAGSSLSVSVAASQPSGYPGRWYRIYLLEDVPNGSPIATVLSGITAYSGGATQVTLPQLVNPTATYHIGAKVLWKTSSSLGTDATFFDNWNGAGVFAPGVVRERVWSEGFQVLDGGSLGTIAYNGPVSVYAFDGTTSLVMSLPYGGDREPDEVQIGWQTFTVGGPLPLEWTWNGTNWVQPPLNYETVGTGSTFGNRWSWALDQVTPSGGAIVIEPNPAAAAPFASVVDNFFSPDNLLRSQFNIQVHARVRFGSTWLDASTASPIPFQRISADYGIAEIYFEDTDPHGQTTVTRATAAHLLVTPHVIIQATSSQGLPITPKLKIRRIDTSTDLVSCGDASDYYAVNLTGDTYNLTPAAALGSLIETEGPGQYAVFFLVSTDCPDTTSPSVTYVVNPDQTVAVRFHVRDHIGTSSMSRLYSTLGDTSSANTIALGDLTLYPHVPEYAYTSPFGERLPTISTAVTDQFRFTDHEFDEESGFNYMKGRFQLATFGKFNRPDPQRDWNWLAPHTMNLYEYVSNDPVNKWDPTGLFGDPFSPQATNKAAKEMEQQIISLSNIAYGFGEAGFDFLYWSISMTIGGGIGRDTANTLNLYLYDHDQYLIEQDQGRQALTDNFFFGLDAITHPTTSEFSEMSLPEQSKIVGHRLFDFSLISSGYSRQFKSLLGSRATDMPGAVETSAVFESPGSIFRVNPKSIRFSQDSIGPTFRNKKPIAGLADDLKSGAASADTVPPINLIRKGELIFSLDNRRLWAFQQAGVPVRAVAATAAKAAKESYKFTTKNKGRSIRIREAKKNE